MKKFKKMLTFIILFFIAVQLSASALDKLNDLLFKLYILKGNAAEVKRMIQNNKINVNTPDDTGYSPIHYALIDKPDTDVVKSLIAAGADINKKTPTGIYPLKLAMISGNNEVIAILKEKNAVFADDIMIEIGSKTYLLSAEAQKYLTISSISKYKKTNSVLIIQEPHYFDDQWNLFRGLEVFYGDNPVLIEDSIFLAEGEDAYKEISLEPLFRAAANPSDEMIRNVLDSFLIPAYMAFEWKHDYGIPIIGMEDKGLHECSAGLWMAISNDTGLWNLSVIARNKQMADTLIKVSKEYVCPIMFVGGLHLNSLDTNMISKARKIIPANIPEKYRQVLNECENLGIEDYLKKQEIGYTFIYAHSYESKEKMDQREKLYKELFRSQMSKKIDEYITNYYEVYIKKKGGVTVTPSVEDAAKLVMLMSASDTDKDKDKGGEKKPADGDKGGEKKPGDKDKGGEKKPADGDKGGEKKPGDKDKGGEKKPGDKDKGGEKKPGDKDKDKDKDTDKDKNKDKKWKLGKHKSLQKWINRMKGRGWTPEQITEAINKGKKFPAPNNVNPANTATRYVHPETGRSVVVDDGTQEILGVGGDGFKW